MNPPLDRSYRERAIPAASARYWSWLFAAPGARDALLGIYALGAEWRALADPSTEGQIAATKLAWWREEVGRLAAGAPVHPVSRFLCALPRAQRTDFTPFAAAVAAAQAEIGGVPLEHGRDLESHADALLGGPLRVAAALSEPPAAAPDDPAESAGAARTQGLAASTRALAAGLYLSRALREYRRAAHHGRTAFAVDELLAAGIETTDLAAPRPPERLQAHLEVLQSRAEAYYRRAAQLLPAPARAPQRGLLVLAEVGRRRVARPGGPEAPPPRLEVFWAWRAARRATQSSPPNPE
jgi:phytoene synthase